MTAPSRIPHGEAVRNAVRVEWMRLETAADLRAAWCWLSSHGVESRVHARVGELDIYDGADWPVMCARLGQVLAFNPGSGEFTVWEAGRFDEAHSEVVSP